MRSLRVVFALVVWPFAMLPGQYIGDPRISAAQQCFRPWLDGLDSVIKRLPNEIELKKFREVLSDPAFAEQVSVGGQRGIHYLAPAPYRQNHQAGVASVCLEEKLPQVWKNFWGTNRFVAQYDYGNQVLILRAASEVPLLLRGLTLVHEMRHRWQSEISYSVEYREVDAYEFHFDILDRLNLPGYTSLLRDEVQRIQRDIAERGQSQQNPRDPRVARVFNLPPSANSLARASAANLLFLRANFKRIEESLAGEVAKQKKRDLLAQLYK